jgi:DNA-binding transcriptional MerR regulator
VDQEYLTTEGLAELLGRPQETLRYWRSRERGPKWTRGPGTRHVLYARADVDEWLRSGQREVQPV